MTTTVDLDDPIASYLYHLRRRLAQFDVWDRVALLVGMAALGHWLVGYVEGITTPIWTLWSGVLLWGVTHELFAVFMGAVSDTARSRPWYGIGRTVHHPTLGPCLVLEYDDRPAVRAEHTWVLITPQQGAAQWKPLCEVIRPTNPHRDENNLS